MNQTKKTTLYGLGVWSLVLVSSFLLMQASFAEVAVEEKTTEKKAEAKGSDCDSEKEADNKAAAAEKPAAKPKRKLLAKWAEISIDGAYPEGPAMPGLFGDTTESLRDIQGRLKKAAADKSVSGVLLKIKTLQIGMGKLNELKEAIDEVKKSGKPVYAWMEVCTNGSYLIAACCDKIYMPESGVLMIVGFRAEIGFYKNMLDKLDIHSDVMRVGKFKAAAEPYTRTKMSPQFRAEIQRVLDNRHNTMVSFMMKSRGLSEKEAVESIDNGPYSAPAAQKLGLLDDLLYADEMQSLFAKDSNAVSASILKSYAKKKVKKEIDIFTLMQIMSGKTPRKRRSRSPKVAVIYAQGAIMPGKSSNGTMGSDTMVKAIEKAAKDKTVKAVVLRVNSPGGSALASDLIWHALEKLDKPFVVSMGDVAASGGYYISMGADHIYCEPGTITGSIGVVGMRFGLNGLFKKFGIDTDVVTRGENSGVMAMTMPLTDSEKLAMTKMMQETYLDFTSKAAKGRKMDVEKLRALAGGRIYTGDAALENKLVDSLGTLNDAIAHAKKLAKFKPGDKVELLELPPPANPFEALFGGGSDASLMSKQSELKLLKDVLPAPVIEHWKRFKLIEQLSAKEPRLLIMPFNLSIR